MIKSPSMSSLSSASPPVQSLLLKEFKSADFGRHSLRGFAQLPSSPRFASASVSKASISFNGGGFSGAEQKRKAFSHVCCGLESQDGSFGGMRRAMSETDLQQIYKKNLGSSRSSNGSARSKNAPLDPRLKDEREREAYGRTSAESKPFFFGEEEPCSLSNTEASRARLNGQEKSRGEFDQSRSQQYFMSSPGFPVVCNSKGCKPVVSDEDEAISFDPSGFEDPVDFSSVRNAERSTSSSRSHQESGSALHVIQAERHYQDSLEMDPANPLLLHNYARFLHEVEGNIPKAEEYYERAILANPGDGEVLSQYAKLIWEAHGDQERAASYFDRAINAAPDNCFVLAAFASFLWSIDSVTDHPEEENVTMSYDDGASGGALGSSQVVNPAQC